MSDLDLIHRKDAEIEILQKEVNKWKNALMGECIMSSCPAKEQLQSEARKEFAERLKEEMCLEDDCDYHCSDCYYECKDYVPVINNVLREMEDEQYND